MKLPAAFVVLAAAALLFAATARGVINGQVDAFEDGTSDSWMNGFGDLEVRTGGPAGAADHCLIITASGFQGAGGSVAGFNANQWTGNYSAAGVNAIEMDLQAIFVDPRNISNTLNIRLAFRSATGGNMQTVGSSGYVTSVAMQLTQDGLWHHVVFDFSSLIPVNSSIATGSVPPPPLATFLTGPAEMRIINSAMGGVVVGDTIGAVLGIDNIHAIPGLKVVTMTRLPNKTVHLTFQGAPNITYNIQASPDLIQPFATLGSVKAAADGTFSFDDLNAPAFPQRIYRASGP